MKKSKEILEYLDKLIPDPKCELNYNKDYELLIAVMLSAHSTDKTVNKVTEVLFKKYPTLEDLRGADLNDLKQIIRSVGTYNVKAPNIKSIAERLLSESKGVVPNNRDFLESLSGVGRKTTNVILSNLFDIPVIAVDTHILRVSKRLGISDLNDDVRKAEDKLTKFFSKEKGIRLHHQLLLFGRYHCRAIKPECENCGLKKYCQGKV